MSGWNATIFRGAAAAGLVTMLAGGAGAVQGILNRADASPLTCKSIVWNDATKQYTVETSEGVTVSIPKEKVTRVRIEKPADMDQAAKLVEARQFAQAVPLLEKIAADYRMLLWDVQARKLLLRAYMGDNNTARIMQTVEDMLKTASRADLPADVLLAYWKALQKAGRADTLQKELDSSIAEGTLDVSAAAYVMRANMSRDAGKKNEALNDYLKVVLLAQQVKEVQPEALFKAAELLEEIKDPRAEDLRKQLRAEFKDNEYTSKLPLPK